MLTFHLLICASSFLIPRVTPAFGGFQSKDSVQIDGLWDVSNNFPMGNCAEHVAKQHGITREDQDAHALESYSRAAAAWSSGKFDAEIAEVTIKHPKGDIVVREDEEYKKVLPAKVPSLKPVFIKAENGGTVTPANASGIQDGASAVVLMTGEAVAEHGVKPLAKILGWADAAIDPIDFPIAPTVAIPLALKNAGVTAEEVDLYELNEAFSGASFTFRSPLPALLPHSCRWCTDGLAATSFAVVVKAAEKICNIDPKKINVRSTLSPILYHSLSGPDT